MNNPDADIFGTAKVDDTITVHGYAKVYGDNATRPATLSPMELDELALECAPLVPGLWLAHFGQTVTLKVSHHRNGISIWEDKVSGWCETRVNGKLHIT